jgi:hypothetical protein
MSGSSIGENSLHGYGIWPKDDIRGCDLKGRV